MCVGVLLLSKVIFNTASLLLLIYDFWVLFTTVVIIPKTSDEVTMMESLRQI